MRHVSVVLFLAVFLLSGWGIVASRGQANETEPPRRTMIAMDLMDLEIPGEGSGDEMELPPIQGAEKSEMEPEPPTAPREPAEIGRSRREAPEVSRAAHSPAPGLVPFLLEDPGVEGGSTLPGTETTVDRASETLTGEFSDELKPVPPPSSHAEGLKLPYGTDTSASGGSDVPEIPLLKSEDRGQRVPVGQDSSLMMKPLPDLRGTSGVSRDSRPSPERRRPEDYLQVREDLDAQLIDIYERYYKDR
jgi:hypothetical protein